MKQLRFKAALALRVYVVKAYFYWLVVKAFFMKKPRPSELSGNWVLERFKISNFLPIPHKKNVLDTDDEANPIVHTLGNWQGFRDDSNKASRKYVLNRRPVSAGKSAIFIGDLAPASSPRQTVPKAAISDSLRDAQLKLDVPSTYSEEFWSSDVDCGLCEIPALFDDHIEVIESKKMAAPVAEVLKPEFSLESVFMAHPEVKEAQMLNGLLGKS